MLAANVCERHREISPVYKPPKNRGGSPKWGRAFASGTPRKFGRSHVHQGVHHVRLGAAFAVLGEPFAANMANAVNVCRERGDLARKFVCFVLLPPITSYH